MIYNPLTSAALQSALNAVVADDAIRLDPTVTYVGNFTFKNRGVIPTGHEIIIESSALTNLLPGPGFRIFPSWSQYLPKLQATQSQTGRNAPCIQFENGANGYWLRNLELLPGFWGAGEQIAIGNNDLTAVAPQNTAAKQPYNIKIDRLYMHGDRLRGQKRGIGMYGKAVTVTGCYMHQYGGVGQDTMCLGGVNGEGPWVIENNTLYGGSYVFITGGSDPISMSDDPVYNSSTGTTVRTPVTVLASPVPTVNGCRLSKVNNLVVGQMIAGLYTDTSDGLQKRDWRYISSINATTGDVTFTSPAPFPFDTPGNVVYGIQLRNITFRRNHCLHDPAWFNPILGTPVISTFNVSSGNIPTSANRYYYAVQGIGEAVGYENSTYYSDTQVSAGLDASIANKQVFIGWSPIPDVTKYRVHRYQLDGPAPGTTGNIINGVYWEVTGTSFTDNNTGGFSSFTAIHSPTRFGVKNLFELKTGTDVLVEANRFEQSWRGNDVGSLMWLKNNNQDGRHEFSQCRDITVRLNKCIHVAGWLSISSQRSSTESRVDQPEPMRNIFVYDNLVSDSGAPWTDSPENDAVYASSFGNGIINLQIYHNTIIHTKSGIAAFDYNTKRQPSLSPVWRDNLFINNTNGFLEGGSFGQGTASLNHWSNNTVTFNKNVLAGGPSGSYTGLGTNYFPTLGSFQAEFKNYDGGIDGDYRLKRISEGDATDSTYINLGTDGKDLGADINAINLALIGVATGDPFVGPQVLQRWVQDDASSTVHTRTIQATTLGSALILGIRVNNTLDSNIITSIVLGAGGAGRTFRQIRRQFSATVRNLECWVLENCPAGETVITATLSSAFIMRWGGEEVTKIATSASDDQKASATGTGTTLNSGPVTTAEANEYIFAIGANAAGSGQTYSAGAGYTSDTLLQVIGRYAQESRSVTALGTYSGTFGLSASDDWSAMIVTFRELPTTTLPSAGLAQGFSTVLGVGARIAASIASSAGAAVIVKGIGQSSAFDNLSDPTIPVLMALSGTVQPMLSNWKIQKTLNARDVLSFQAVSKDGSYRPQLDQEVIILKGINVLFGGVITLPTEAGVLGEGKTPIVTSVTAGDYSMLAERRFVFEQLPAGNLKAALTNIVRYIQGVTLDPAQANGPLLPALTYDGIKTSEVLNDLTLQSNGWVWYVDGRRVLHVVEPSTFAAPFNITGPPWPSLVGDVTVEPRRTYYANRIIVRNKTLQAVVEDPAEEAVRGYWELFVGAPDTVLTQTDMNALAQTILAKSLPIVKVVKYRTRQDGLLPGQSQTIVFPRRNLNNVFLITDVEITSGDKGIEYNITAIEGLVYQTGWRETYKQWGGVGRGVTVPGAGIGTGQPLRFAYFLGGNGIDAVSSPVPTWVPASGGSTTPGQGAVTAQINTVPRGTTAGTVVARLRALDPGVSVQARLFDVTTNAPCPGISAPVLSTNWTTVTFGAILTAGSHFYELQLLPSVANADVMGTGYVE